MEQDNKFREQVKIVYRIIVLFLCLIAVVIAGTFLYVMPEAPKNNDTYISIPVNSDDDRIENGIHVRTGLVQGEGLMEVVHNCTNCHSAQLVTQNRMHKEQWIATIRWMQETQNLWDLGNNEAIIVNYLATYYVPEKKGRRENLSGIVWYELD